MPLYKISTASLIDENVSTACIQANQLLRRQIRISNHVVGETAKRTKQSY